MVVVGIVAGVLLYLRWDVPGESPGPAANVPVDGQPSGNGTGTIVPTTQASSALSPTPPLAPTPISTPAPEVLAGPDVQIGVAEMLTQERINRFRESRGLTVLASNSSLAAVARTHSKDMADRDYFDHLNPEGLGPQDRVEGAGLVDFACGENIVSFTNAEEGTAGYIAEEAFTGWLNSPGHYDNMVEASYDTGGVGVVVRSKILARDPIPKRYDIYVTHLLCRDVSEYNRVKAQYDEARALYAELLVEFESLKAEYRRVEELYVQNVVPYPEVEEAYRRMQEAQAQLNVQVGEVNYLLDRMEKAAGD